MTDGILISNLRPEIQIRVNSVPDKYDPNGNDVIDRGDELSLLLSDYECEEKDLTSHRHPRRTMLTKQEKEVIYRSSNPVQTGLAIGIGVGGLWAFLDRHNGGRGCLVFFATAGIGWAIGALVKHCEKKKIIKELKKAELERANEIQEKKNNQTVKYTKI